MTNTLAYYDTKLFMTVERFIVQGPGFVGLLSFSWKSNESNFETTNLFEQSFLIDQIDFSYLNTHWQGRIMPNVWLS